MSQSAPSNRRSRHSLARQQIQRTLGVTRHRSQLTSLTVPPHSDHQQESLPPALSSAWAYCQAGAAWEGRASGPKVSGASPRRRPAPSWRLLALPFRVPRAAQPHAMAKEAQDLTATVRAAVEPPAPSLPPLRPRSDRALRSGVQRWQPDTVGRRVAGRVQAERGGELWRAVEGPLPQARQLAPRHRGRHCGAHRSDALRLRCHRRVG